MTTLNRASLHDLEQVLSQYQNELEIIEDRIDHLETTGCSRIYGANDDLDNCRTRIDEVEKLIANHPDTQQRLAPAKWMQSFTGLAVDLPIPPIEQITLTDIAHALGNTCRYNGHCDKFYSVAEHCVLISQCYLNDHPKDYAGAMQALLHDACEAYNWGDVIRPAKGMIPNAKEVEDAVTRVIHKALGCPWQSHKAKAIKDYDTAICVAESEKLLKDHPRQWLTTDTTLNVDFHCWNPPTAKSKFMQRFAKLKMLSLGVPL